MQIRRWFTSWSAKPISAMIKTTDSAQNTFFFRLSMCNCDGGSVGQTCPAWATLTYIHQSFTPLRSHSVSGLLHDIWDNLGAFLPWQVGQVSDTHIMPYATICHLMPPYATSRNLQVPRQIKSCQFSSRHWLSEMYRPQQVRIWEIRQGPFHDFQKNSTWKFRSFQVPGHSTSNDHDVHLLCILCNLCPTCAGSLKCLCEHWRRQNTK